VVSSAVGSDEVPDALTSVIDSIETVISTDNSSVSSDGTATVVSEQPTGHTSSIIDADGQSEQPPVVSSAVGSDVVSDADGHSVVVSSVFGSDMCLETGKLIISSNELLKADGSFINLMEQVGTIVPVMNSDEVSGGVTLALGLDEHVGVVSMIVSSSEELGSVNFAVKSNEGLDAVNQITIHNQLLSSDEHMDGFKSTENVVDDCEVSAVAHGAAGDESERVVGVASVVIESDDTVPYMMDMQRSLGSLEWEVSNQSRTEVRSRKRLADVENWARNKRKKLCQSGQSYFSDNGKVRRARAPKTIVCHHPPQYNNYFHCSEFVNMQGELHRAVWSLNDDEKTRFLASATVRFDKKTKSSVASRRSYSICYYFVDKGERKQVCKRFFLGTLDISGRRVDYYYSRRIDSQTGFPVPGKRGRNVKKRIPEDRSSEICDRSH
jgi:hypothetical protein